MSSRDYNKLYVHTDREEGSEKILLGYKHDGREFILYKDAETSFHIPAYTNSVKIADSSLIQDGATGGHFPAVSDRIFKNRKGYGNSTPNGSASDLNDGMWFCSWLQKDIYGNLTWLDRYYNPGAFKYDEAIEQLYHGPIYETHNPVFRDIPSTMVLEAGGHYKYFHVGERSAAELVDTFGGVNGERLKLNLDSWTSSVVDSSLQARDVKIKTSGRIEKVLDVHNSDRVAAPVLRFDNNYNTDVYLDYDADYNPTEEFTWSAWIYSDDWQDSQSTMLFGNFSPAGGVGLFLDTLSSYPFFVIPELTYGHLLYTNERFRPFLDKSVQLTPSITATPEFVSLDRDSNVIVCTTDLQRNIYKFDHTGKLLNVNKMPTLEERPQQLLCGPDNTVIIITENYRYTFDNQLSLIKTTLWKTLSTDIAAFAVLDNGNTELITFPNLYDSKFIGTTNWCISADGHLYRKTAGQQYHEVFARFLNKATTFGIDPYNRLWVLHGTNDVSVFDLTFKTPNVPAFKFDVGTNVPHLQKNISFICCYDRATLTRTWKCIIFYADGADIADTPKIYIYDLNGNQLDTIDTLSLFNREIVENLKQNQGKFNFLGKGDFTGYEHKRVFNQAAPYRGNPQLVLKASLRDKSKTELVHPLFKATFPIHNWDKQSWQHIVVVLKNHRFNVYNNGQEIITLLHPGLYELTYEDQPGFYVGSPGGVQVGFNQEIANYSAIFNGVFESIKIYDYALNPKNLEMFQRAAIPAENMYWTLPTPSIQYIEQIERMFKNKIPGAKASYFRIKLHGSQIKDVETRAIIEQEVRNLISEIKPAYTDFLGIQWID